MHPAQLFCLAGFAAILGGLLRVASAFPLPLSAIEHEALWDITDAFFTLGLIGVYLDRAPRLGFLGLASFVVAIAALSFIGGPDADPFGFSTYEQGAAALLIALLGLSIAWLRAGERPLWPPLLWFASAIAAGALSALPAPWPDYGFTSAGIFFGLGFCAAGWPLARAPKPLARAGV
jgi:hypothetical protein